MDGPKLIRLPDPPRVEPPDPEELHRLEVRMDIAREQVLLWRIGVVVAALVGLLLLREGLR